MHLCEDRVFLSIVQTKFVHFDKEESKDTPSRYVAIDECWCEVFYHFSFAGPTLEMLTQETMLFFSFLL